MKDVEIILQPMHWIFAKLVSASDEIYLAASLVKNSGLSWLKDKVFKKGKVKLTALIGIALPSEPNAIQRIWKFAVNSGGYAKIYKGEIFHPKVYLFCKKKRYTAIIGSSNLTAGGMESNIEMNLLIKNQLICNQLYEHFNKWINDEDVIPITESFIKDYTKSYLNRQKFVCAEKSEVKAIIRKTASVIQAKVRDWEKLIENAKNYRKNSKYEEHKRKRAESLVEIKRSIDYPHFNKIDLDRFYEISDLGHIIAVNKPILKRNRKKLADNLRFLTNETLPIEQRIDSLIGGPRYQYGLGINIITKVLTAVYPKKYGVWNDLSLRVLKRYGFSVPRGISAGTRYRLLCELLRKIAEKSGLDDLNMVDSFFTDERYKSVNS